jgi:hypothetical protein
MSLELIFKLCNIIALIGWVLNIISNKPQVERFIVGIIVALLAIVYTYFVIVSFKFSDAQSFSSLHGVRSLFADDQLLMAGWVHYLAFDLMTGVIIRNNAKKYSISFWLVLPCLLFTFMLGPAGLLMYLLIRWMVIKQYFTQNF